MLFVEIYYILVIEEVERIGVDYVVRLLNIGIIDGLIGIYD